MHDEFWTIWKYIGIAILGMEFLLMISVIIGPPEWFGSAIMIMVVLMLCIVPLAAIDMYQGTR